jgi:hypothetical protein
MNVVMHLFACALLSALVSVVKHLEEEVALLAARTLEEEPGQDLG